MRTDWRVPLPVTGVRLSLWRAVSTLRVAALAVDLYLILRWHDIYARPGVALLAGAGMIVVTAAIGWLGVRGLAHRPVIVGADLLATIGLTLLTMPAQTHAQSHGGMVTLTTIWAVGPTIEIAFVFGALGGALTGLAQYAVSALIAGQWDGRTLYSGVLLVLTGTVVGYVTDLAVRAEDDLRTATAARAALAERERLARSIHDGVLQILGLVHRTGRDAAAPWANLAAAAGQQEAALRGLITSGPPTASGARDLGDELRALRGDRVTVSTPAEPVVLAPAIADEVVDAVRAALQNVAAHAGPDASAWVLLDDDAGTLRVTVRDDGVGFAPDRLASAEREGRLGVAKSLRGRITDLGGSCTIRSVPGEGTEIELAVPVRSR